MHRRYYINTAARMQPKAIRLANASVIPVTTGFMVRYRAATGRAMARASSSTLIVMRNGLCPATMVSATNITCHIHDAATYERFPRSRIMVLTTNTEPYWMSANSAVAISPFMGKEPAGHQARGPNIWLNPGIFRIMARAASVSAPHEACAALRGIAHAVLAALPNDVITVAIVDAAITDTALPHSERSFLNHEDSIDSATSTIYKGAQRSMPVCVIRNGRPITVSATV